MYIKHGYLEVSNGTAAMLVSCHCVKKPSAIKNRPWARQDLSEMRSLNRSPCKIDCNLLALGTRFGPMSCRWFRNATLEEQKSVVKVN